MFVFHCLRLLGVDYGLADEIMIGMIEQAKLLSGPDAFAADIINLTKCMVEYEADVKFNVGYMINGLTERAVFEFTKKKIAGESIRRYE